MVVRDVADGAAYKGTFSSIQNIVVCTQSLTLRHNPCFRVTNIKSLRSHRRSPPMGRK
jgi:hypothetical protein